MGFAMIFSHTHYCISLVYPHHPSSCPPLRSLVPFFPLDSPLWESTQHVWRWEQLTGVGFLLPYVGPGIKLRLLGLAASSFTISLATLWLPIKSIFFQWEITCDVFCFLLHLLSFVPLQPPWIPSSPCKVSLLLFCTYSISIHRSIYFLAYDVI